jgi:soluble lytic murein transglycosylase-like protein
MENTSHNYLETIMLSVIVFICLTVLTITTVVRCQYPEPEVTIVKIQEPIISTVELSVQESIVYEPSSITVVSKPLSDEEIINNYIYEICSVYDVKPELIKAIVYHESRYNPKAKNGNCLGLMQISKRWHSDRAKKLGVTDFYDSYSNILIGTDYISELLHKYKDPTLVLMLYSMDNQKALSMYKKGKVSTYAKVVLAKAKEFEQGVK